MLRKFATLSFVSGSALAGQCDESESKLWLNNDTFTDVIKKCAANTGGSVAGTTNCMASQIGGLSSGCASCFGQTVDCGKKHCMAECVHNSAAQQCLECTKKSGCDDALNVCTGFGQGPPKPKLGAKATSNNGNSAGSVSAVLALALPVVLITLSVF